MRNDCMGIGKTGADIVRFQVRVICQQAVEKYSKALLQELGLHVPKSHVLEDLFNLLLPHHPTLKPLRRS